jgi:hypothetical protein
MRKQYSDAFIEQALVKVYSRGEGRTNQCSCFSRRRAREDGTLQMNLCWIE